MRLKAFAAVCVLYKSFWVFTRSRRLVMDQRFGTTYVSHHQGLSVTLMVVMMGHISSLETLVHDQRKRPSKNPKTFIQQTESRQAGLEVCVTTDRPHLVQCL